MKTIKEVNEQNYLEKMQRKEESEAMIREQQVKNVKSKVEAAQRRQDSQTIVFHTKRNENQMTKQLKQQFQSQIEQ